VRWCGEGGTDLPVYFVNRHSWGAKTSENADGFIQKYNPKGTEIPASLVYLGRVVDSLNLSDPCYISD
jgi:IS30 family transposase